MPSLTRLAAELVDLRSGRGHFQRRQQLRQQLAAIDQQLRRARNVEMFRLANAKIRLAALDSRHDPAPLQAMIEASTHRLAALDLRIAEAVARGLGQK